MIDKIFQTAEKITDESEVLIINSESISADLKRENIAIGSSCKGSGLIIRVIKDGKIGVSSTDNPENWKKCLQAAVNSSKFADKINWKGLPDPKKIDLTPQAYDSRIKPEPELIQKLLNQLLEGSEKYPANITSGSVSISISNHTLENNHGLSYHSKATQVNAGIELIAGQSTGYESDAAWNLDSIDPVKIGEDAAFFAAKGQNGIDLKTGQYDIVFSPIAFAQLLEAAVIPAISGRNIHTGRSFFAGKMGEKVAKDTISIIDDPYDPRGLANCAYDGEGMEVQKNAFITEGELTSYAYDLRTAYRYDQKPTASAVRSGQSGAPSIGNHNLTIQTTPESTRDEKALYVHSLIGAHTANPMSGDFSVELSSPFFVQEGNFQEPIHSGMISGNIFNLLHEIEACSHETRTMGSLILPEIRISGVSVIGRG